MSSSRSRSRVVASTLVVLVPLSATFACASRERTAVSANAPISAPAASTADVAYMTQTFPAGRTVLLRFDAPLSSASAKEGDRFSASLELPLVASDGSTIAPKGAKIRGRILRVDHDAMNRVVLRFDTVEIGDHFVPIHAEILRIEAAQVTPADPSERDSTAAAVYPLQPWYRPIGVGGGPPPEVPVQIQWGAFVEIYFSRPFVVLRPSETAVPKTGLKASSAEPIQPIQPRPRRTTKR